MSSLSSIGRRFIYRREIHRRNTRTTSSLTVYGRGRLVYSDTVNTMDMFVGHAAGLFTNGLAASFY